jgi:hypothetical protein
MDQTELIKQITNNIGKVKVLGLSKILHENRFNLRELIAITFHHNKDVAFRATWLLENVFLDNPETYLPDLEFLLSGITKVKHPGPRRHYAKIVMHITEPSAARIIKDKVQLLDMEPVVEQLFEWIITSKVKIAVKAFAAEALFNMKDRYPWVKDELAQQLQFLMRDGTAAIQSKGKKLLQQLT